MEEIKLDWESFKPFFHESWHTKIQPIIESKDVYEIYQKLKAFSRDGKKIVPISKNTFKVFKETDLTKIKVVWVLMDPYCNLYKDGTPQADGIPLSCTNSKDGKLQPSLEKFYDAIQDSYKEEVERSPSLNYLLNQGVLLLNSDLTCEARKTGSHEGLWEPFMKMLFEDVFQYHVGMIYIFSGKASSKLLKYVNPIGNYIIQTEHPASASYQHRSWDYKNVFTQINSLIKINYSDVEQIMWNKTIYDKKLNECPF